MFPIEQRQQAIGLGIKTYNRTNVPSHGTDSSI